MTIKIPEKNEHRCQQTQCSFFREGGCKACDDCKSTSYIINQKCKRCFACENVPGSLRWGENQNHKSDLVQIQFEDFQEKQQEMPKQEKIIEIMR